jgi:hypothetical protein
VSHAEAIVIEHLDRSQWHLANAQGIGGRAGSLGAKTPRARRNGESETESVDSIFQNHFGLTEGAWI